MPHPTWDGVNVGSLLTLEPHAGRYRSTCNEDNRNGRVFGGQLLGQALRAAQASVDTGRPATLLQVMFAQGAIASVPIDYTVRTLQEGKRFSSRQVEARQGERLLISAHASFQVPVEGPQHALGAHVCVPPPEQLASMPELVGRPGLDGFDWGWFQKGCLELKPVDPHSHLPIASSVPRTAHWVRLRAPLGDDPAVHAAALAYVSDYWINTAAITHHVPARNVVAAMYVASLNHTLWLHRPCRADEWLLFSLESPATQGQRALTTARIFDRAGTLVACAAQECLFAPRPD